MLRYKKIKGFSLLEVILALAIGAAVLAALSMIFRVAKQSWNINSRRGDLIQHARLALWRLSTDLRYTTNLVQADTAAIVFDTTVLEDTNELDTEQIRYTWVSGFNRQVDTNPASTVAGDVTRGIFVSCSNVQPMKLDGSNNLVPLAIGDPISMAIALDIEVTANNNPQMIILKTMVNFRGK